MNSMQSLHKYKLENNYEIRGDQHCPVGQIYVIDKTILVSYALFDEYQLYLKWLDVKAEFDQDLNKLANS